MHILANLLHLLRTRLVMDMDMDTDMELDMLPMACHGMPWHGMPKDMLGCTCILIGSLGTFRFRTEPVNLEPLAFKKGRLFQ